MRRWFRQFDSFELIQIMLQKIIDLFYSFISQQETKCQNKPNIPAMILKFSSAYANCIPD